MLDLPKSFTYYKYQIEQPRISGLCGLAWHTWIGCPELQRQQRSRPNFFHPIPTDLGETQGIHSSSIHCLFSTLPSSSGLSSSRRSPHPPVPNHVDASPVLQVSPVNPLPQCCSSHDKLEHEALPVGGEQRQRHVSVNKSAYLTLNGLHVLRSLEMPSFLAEAPASAVTGLFPHDKRSSFDRQSQAADRIDGHENQHPEENHNAPNGVLPNGSANSPFARSNGLLAETKSHASRESLSHQHQQGVPGDRSKRSSAVDPDKAQAFPPRGDSRIAPKDDGYFATAKAAEVEDGCLETHVKLDAVNGDIQHRDEGGPSIPREDTVLQHDILYTEPAKMSPGDMLESDVDGSLRVPNQPNRISSPPALQKDNSNALTLSPSNRLQQRHTLEVPRVSTTRLSRESPNRADLAEVISASGRVTPSTPTRRRGSMTLVRRATRSLHSDMHLDDVTQDEDAARWTEVLRQKRVSKRKRKEEEEEEDGRVVMGTKVDQNHVNYVTAYNMLTGIRFTVSRTNAKLDRELTDADFEARHKFSFDV